MPVPFDLTRPLVAWQRRKWIIAVGEAAQEVGRLMIGARQPISLDVARRILSVSALQYMSEPFDSFLGAQASAGRPGRFLPLGGRRSNADALGRGA